MKNDRPEQFQLKVTAQLLMSILSGSLYANHEYCLWEIVRNSLCACSPNESTLEPKVGNVEIHIKEHPLGGQNPALIVLDHGRGFTDEGYKRFTTLGSSILDLALHPGGMHGGASKYRIGRFAALALNEQCYSNRDGATGFVVLTRRKKSGDIVVMPIIPNDIEETGCTTRYTVSPDARELGFLKGIKGSFTAVIIANPVYTTYQQVRDALAYRIPRSKDKMFTLLVGGVQLDPPPLASELIASNEVAQIHLRRAHENEQDTGVWFCDKATGSRVAAARQMSSREVPYPFNSLDLCGDIFVANLVGDQGVTRQGLTAKFLHSPEWTKVKRALISESDRARGLLGESTHEPRSTMRKAMQDFTLLCNSVFGEPQRLGDEYESGRAEKREPEKRSHVTRDDSGGDSSKQNTGEKVERKRGTTDNVVPKRIPQWIKIGEKSYLVLSIPDDPLIPVAVAGGRIYLNESCALTPSRQEARDEYLLNAVFMAVAASEDPSATFNTTQRRAAKWRQALIKKK